MSNFPAIPQVNLPVIPGSRTIEPINDFKAIPQVHRTVALASDPGVGDFNSWAFFEDFDRGAVGTLTTGPGTTYVDALTTTNLTNTMSGVLEDDIAGTAGTLMTASTTANTTAGLFKYSLFTASPARLGAMYDNGFKAELRFWLDSAGLTGLTGSSVTFGWHQAGANTVANLDTNGSNKGHVGALISGSTLSLVHRNLAGAIVSQAVVAPLQAGVVYTLSLDTLGSMTTLRLFTGLPTALVLRTTASIPKWRGWTGSMLAKDLFSTTATAANRTGFGVVSGFTANNPAAVRKHLGIDAVSVYCPRVR